MAVNEIHVGDIGTIFEVTIKDGASTLNVAGASTKQIIFKRPDNQTVAKAASFKTDGSDGILQYTTVSGDLNQNGTWSLQANLVLAAGTWRSDITTFEVHANL